MAIYSASVKTVSRAGGRSATAAAAYRNGEEITDERTGEVHDYTRRSGVVHTSSFAPDGMKPQPAAELWNRAELSETRKNARVAREVLVALPAELTADQRRELAEDMAQRLADRYGTAGTLAVHLPDKEGDQRNHHAHILMTTRRLEHSGELGEKTRELDDVKRGPQEVEWIREMVEHRTNHALERAGHDERVDRRSLEQQRAAALEAGDVKRAAELDRLPTIHEGPRVTQIRREAEREGRPPLGNVVRLDTNNNRRQLNTDRAELKQVAQVIDFAQAKASREAVRADALAQAGDLREKMRAELEARKAAEQARTEALAQAATMREQMQAELKQRAAEAERQRAAERPQRSIEQPQRSAPKKDGPDFEM